MHETTTTTTEETHLLEREGGFSRRKQIASAVGVFALAIGGVAVAGSRGQFTSSPTYSSRLRAERRAKLGAPETTTTTTKFSLSTGCSPLNKLPFDTDSDFTGRVAAKIVTKGMSNDFLFEKGQDMKEVSCGNYEVDTSIALNIRAISTKTAEPLGMGLHVLHIPLPSDPLV